jgi:hypothetical protein
VYHGRLSVYGSSVSGALRPAFASRAGRIVTLIGSAF